MKSLKMFGVPVSFQFKYFHTFVVILDISVLLMLPLNTDFTSGDEDSRVA